MLNMVSGCQVSNAELQISYRQLAGCIDHALLDSTATQEQIRQACQGAVDFGFHAVCVNPRWVPLVAEQLYNTKVKVASVVNVPLGADSTKIKVAQAKDVIFAGTDEIDMMADLAAIIEGDWRYLSNQVEAVLKICRSMRPPVVLKVIIESAALTQQQKVFACQVLDACRVDFIKTSTGLHPAGGATIEDVKLIKQAAPNCKIKAAGGIRTARQALEMLQAGAERIGTSSGPQIIEQFRAGQLQ